MKVQTLFVSVFAVALLDGCGSSTEPIAVNCPDVLRGSVLVSVRDSASGALMGNAVTATAIDGSYFDAVTTPDLPAYASRPIPLVETTRAGKYDVYVSKAGFEPWVTRGVVVKQGACGTEQVNVTAKLQKEGS